VEPWRKKLDSSAWLDVKYEELVVKPERVLKQICNFLQEDYSPAMLDFHQTQIAKARGATKDHKPLGHPVSAKYIGIYKELLSLRDQRIFAAVAGRELAAAGYTLDVEPVKISQEQADLFRELDGRIRAATLDAPEGHIVYESYNDWLVDQRRVRREKGIWANADELKAFPAGDPDEEMIMGQRAWRKWKDIFCLKRKYTGKAAL
jgi:hypothetical protein